MAIDVILIDDESHALRELEYFLGRYPEFRVVGAFTHPLKALEAMKNLKPACMFLDIHMPMLGGIDFASRLLDEDASVDVVFVTAYDHHALDAFEVSAMDYLLKPIDAKRFDRTIHRLIRKQVEREQRSRKQQRPDPTDRRLWIQCLGTFQIRWEGEDPVTWRTRKDRELIAFLLHHEGTVLSKEKIVEALWPDEDPDVSANRLYRGIYALRKSLEAHGIHREHLCIRGKYSLNLRNAVLDTALFEDNGGSQSLNDNNLNDNKEDGHTLLTLLEKQAKRYTGDYFGDEGWPWAYPRRTALLEKYLALLLTIAHIHIAGKNYDSGELFLLKAFQKEPYEKKITLKLLELYRHTRQKAKGVNHFIRYETLLSDELGISPESDIIDAYQSIDRI